MSGQILRSKYMRDFSGLDRYPTLEGRLIVASYFSQIAVSVIAGHIALQMPASVLSYLFVAFFAIFIATRLRGLNNIVHECCHATFVQDRAENARLGSVCASAILSCYKDYRDEHLTHHQHLGDYERDLDLQGIEDLRLHDPLTVSTFLRHLVTPLIGRHLPYYLGANLSGRDGKAYLGFKLGLIAASIGLLVLAPLTAVVMVFVPFLFIYSALNYWTDCLDHAGLVDSEDELDASRNILAPLPLRLLLFPRYDCYHLVHHLFPQVPAKHLQSVHRILEQDITYSSKPHATYRATRTDHKVGIIHPAE